MIIKISVNVTIMFDVGRNRFRTGRSQGGGASNSGGRGGSSGKHPRSDSFRGSGRGRGSFNRAGGSLNRNSTMPTLPTIGPPMPHMRSSFHVMPPTLPLMGGFQGLGSVQPRPPGM